MNKRFMRVMSILVCYFCFTTGSALCTDLVIICNKDIPENSLTAREVKDIFTWKKKTWEDGSRITFVLLKKRDVLSLFTEAYLNKTRMQYEMFIKNEVFINGSKIPRSFNTDEGVVEYVSNTKGAIGFISEEPETWLVKPMAIK